MDPLSREFLLAFWKVHLLHHAAEGPVYGHWISEELRTHGYTISPGTLYPLLARRERNGWVVSRSSVPGLKARKDHTLTSEGKELLALLRAKVKEMCVEACGEAFHAQRRLDLKPVPASNRPRGPAKQPRRTTVSGSRKKTGTVRKKHAR